MHVKRPARLVTLLLALPLIAGLDACAGGGGASSGPRRSANRITAEELEPVAQFDCYQAIQRLRPTWFQSRTGGTPAVFMDGSEQVGGTGALQAIPVLNVQEIRFLPARDATTRFGTGYPNGAILVTTKARD